MREVLITFAAASTVAIGALQSPTSGVPLTLSYAQVDIQRTITLTSTANLSGINFVFSGFDMQGNVVTETLAGPNNTTVTTTNQYGLNTPKLTITPSATNAGTLTIGSGLVGATRWVKPSLSMTPFALTVAVGITGTASVTVQDSPDSVAGNTNPLTFNHPTIASVTASTESNYAFPARNVRCLLNSSSAGAVVSFFLIQAGIGGA